MTLAAETLACVRGERQVFAGLDFGLEAGQALVLRGPNGAGKTSLLRIIATFLKPAAGRVTWDGIDLWNDVETHRRRLGYVGHLDAQKPLLTVAENLHFWRRLVGGTGDWGAALEAFGIQALAEVPVQLLSAGQRRRAALARLVVAPSDLWLLDEPGVSLDDDGLQSLAAAIQAQCARGGMVIAATHQDLGLPDARILTLGRDRAA